MKKFVLLVAGGSGSRMGGTVPKQFMNLSGLPVLMRTMQLFYDYDSSISCVVVIAEYYFDYWKSLCEEYNFRLPHQLAAGGISRFQSVKNGLSVLPDDGIVFIHDGVRPLVSFDTLANCEQAAVSFGNALPVISLVDSIRQLDGHRSHGVDRDCFRLVQTPQTFRLDLIKEAYRHHENPGFTDDASVCEAMGVKIHLVDGNRENIKLTHPQDIKFAEFLDQQKN